MDPHLTNIYGTGGFEKTASAESGLCETLSDLALLIAQDIHDENADFEKVAHAHNEILDTLAAYDQAGRALAHSEFEELEKQANAGNTEGIDQFFEDVIDEMAYEEEQIDTDALRQAIIEELESRQEQYIYIQQYNYV